MKKKIAVNKWLVIAIVLCMLSAIGSKAVMTSAGEVEVSDISITTPVGTLTGNMYVPEDASKDAPRPGIVVSHGANAASEAVSEWCLELARRGYVVFSPNLYEHGDSPVPDAKYKNTLSVQTNGLYDATEYLYSLAIVDKNNIGITGHSLGGGKSIAVAQYYTELETEALKKGASKEEAKALNKIKSCLTVGYPLEVKIDSLPAMSSPDFEGYRCDLGVILGKADDFQSWMNKDVLTNEYGVRWLKAQTGVKAKEVEEGKYYSDLDAGGKFVMWNPNEIHNQNMISKNCMTYMIEFFEETLGSTSELSASNQIWKFKMAFDFLGIVGFFLFILPCINLLMKLPVFSSLKKNEAKSFPPLIGNKKKKYIRSVVMGAVINTVILLPCVTLGSLALVNVIWPQSPTSGFAVWGVVSGLLTLLFVKIGTGHKIFKNREEFGLNITAKDFGKVLILGFLAVACTYSLVFLADYFFDITFKCWTYILRPFDKARFLQALRYLPLFGVQQLANSIATSRNNFENWSDKKRIAFSTVLATVPVILIMTITYLPILFTGSPMWGQDGSNLLLLTMGSGSTRVFNFIFSMATLSFINVKTQKVTGTIWLGSIVNLFLITMTSAASCGTISNF